MNVFISGSAGSVAYFDGEDLHYLRVGYGEGWKTTSIGATRRVFLDASDVVEVEVSNVEEAEAIGELWKKIAHGMMLVDLVLKSENSDAAKLGSAYLDELLADDEIRREIEERCLSIPFPERIDIDASIARTSDARSRELLEKIAANHRTGVSPVI